MITRTTVSMTAAQWTLAASMLVIGCRLKHREIEFIFPDGFKGPFIIIKNAAGPSGAFHQDKLTLMVPASRVVLINDDSALNEWTVRSARFASGDSLPIDNEHDRSLIALRGGGYSSGMRQGLTIPPHHSYFVGTEDEFEKCDFSELENQIAV